MNFKNEFFGKAIDVASHGQFSEVKNFILSHDKGQTRNAWLEFFQEFGEKIDFKILCNTKGTAANNKTPAFFIYLTTLRLLFQEDGESGNIVDHYSNKLMESFPEVDPTKIILEHDRQEKELVEKEIKGFNIDIRQWLPIQAKWNEKIHAENIKRLQKNMVSQYKTRFIPLYHGVDFAVAILSIMTQEARLFGIEVLETYQTIKDHLMIRLKTVPVLFIRKEIELHKQGFVDDHKFDEYFNYFDETTESVRIGDLDEKIYLAEPSLYFLSKQEPLNILKEGFKNSDLDINPGESCGIINEFDDFYRDLMYYILNDDGDKIFKELCSEIPMHLLFRAIVRKPEANGNGKRLVGGKFNHKESNVNETPLLTVVREVIKHILLEMHNRKVSKIKMSATKDQNSPNGVAYSRYIFSLKGSGEDSSEGLFEKYRLHEFDYDESCFTSFLTKKTLFSYSERMSGFQNDHRLVSSFNQMKRSKPGAKRQEIEEMPDLSVQGLINRLYH